MEAPGHRFQTVDEYISSFSKGTQAILQELRQTIKAAAPHAVEVISYNMPAVRQNGVLVYYASYKEHIGFYPTASGIANFKDRFTDYKSSKGAVQFPIDKPLPLSLVTSIVKFRLKEDAVKTKADSRR